MRVRRVAKKRGMIMIMMIEGHPFLGCPSIHFCTDEGVRRGMFARVRRVTKKMKTMTIEGHPFLDAPQSTPARVRG